MVRWPCKKRRSKSYARRWVAALVTAGGGCWLLSSPSSPRGKQKLAESSSESSSFSPLIFTYSTPGQYIHCPRAKNEGTVEALWIGGEPGNSRCKKGCNREKMAISPPSISVSLRLSLSLCLSLSLSLCLSLSLSVSLCLSLSLENINRLSGYRISGLT